MYSFYTWGRRKLSCLQREKLCQPGFLTKCVQTYWKHMKRRKRKRDIVHWTLCALDCACVHWGVLLINSLCKFEWELQTCTYNGVQSGVEKVQEEERHCTLHIACTYWGVFACTRVWTPCMCVSSVHSTYMWRAEWLWLWKGEARGREALCSQGFLTIPPSSTPRLATHILLVVCSKENLLRAGIILHMHIVNTYYPWHPAYTETRQTFHSARIKKAFHAPSYSYEEPQNMLHWCKTGNTSHCAGTELRSNLISRGK